MITSEKLSNLDPLVDPIDDADLLYFVRLSEPVEERGKKGTFSQVVAKLATVFEAIGVAAGLVAAHEAAADPHSQYLTAAEADALFLTPAEGNASYSLIGHTHVSGNITDFAEAVDDRVAALLVQGTNITLTYNDVAGTITIDAAGGGGGITQEQAEDAIAAMIQNGTGITWAYNDALGTLTPTVTITQYTDELAQDAVGGILSDTGDIDFTYDDGTPSISAIVKADSITYAKMQNISATARFIGRISGGAGDPEELTGTQATTLLDVFTNLLKGLVPASGGGTTNFLRADGTWAAPGGGGGSPYIYVATPADVNIASLTDVIIVSDAVTGIAAGDQIIIEAEFIILNNSGATRNIIVTLDILGAAFDIELTLPALAFSSTLMHPVNLRGVLNVRATNLSYFMVYLDMQLAAGIAAGTDTSAAATHLQAKGWGTTTNDLTGTETVELKIRSAAATATQTCRLLSFRIKKLSPTDAGD